MAQEAIDRARVVRETHALVFNRDELAQVNATISSLQVSLDQAKSDKVRESIAKTADEQERMRLEKERAQREEKRRTVASLVDDAKILVWFLLRARPELVPSHDPVRRLDVSVLADRLLGPVLGIGDPRTDKRIDFVGGIRGMDELERRVSSGEHAVAFALFPTRMEDVMDVADAGLVMPPKSTWFEPKLRSGVVVHLIDES